MMEHKAIEFLIHKRLDREITDEENIFLFNHLSQCPECQAYYLEMEMLKDGITGLIEFPLRQDFNARVLTRIKVKKTVYRRKLLPAFIGLYFASLITLLFSPVLNYISAKILLSIPLALHILDKVKSFVNGILILGFSFLRSNFIEIFTLLLVCLIVFWGFITMIKCYKEERWVIKNSY